MFESIYTFYNLKNFNFFRTRSYSSNVLYRERMYIDNETILLNRSVMTIWDVFGNVGGIIQVLLMLSALFFVPYSNLCYKIDIIT